MVHRAFQRDAHGIRGRGHISNERDRVFLNKEEIDVVLKHFEKFMYRELGLVDILEREA